MAAQPLLALARSQKYETLDEAWQEALAEPADVAVLCSTLRTLCDNDSLGVALRLGTQAVDKLVERGKRTDAIAVSTTLVRGGAISEALARTLQGLLEQQYSSEEWYPLALETSGIRPGNLNADSFERFERVRHYTVGNVLYHRAGWGEGVIEKFDAARQELTVRFASGKVQEFPMSSALDAMRPLAADDLRAMRLQAPAELERLSHEDPGALVRKVTQMFRGRATSTEIKTELSPSVVPAKRWATFWKAAKTAAAQDPWLQVDGSSTRPTFVLRKQPLSLADEVQRRLGHTANLGEVILVCRDYLARGLDDASRDVVVELARARVEAAIEGGKERHSHLLDGILFLEEHGVRASMTPADELVALLSSGEEGGFDLQAIDQLMTQESKQHAVRLLAKAFGEGWAELCIKSITRCPETVIETLVEQLHASGKATALIESWERVAPFPKRHSTLLFHLGRMYAEGVFDSVPQRPDLVSVSRLMMTLTRMLGDERRGDPAKARLRTRLTSLLTGRRALLDRCFVAIGRDELASFLQIVERAGEDFPQEIVDATLRAVANRHPDLTRKPERAFWDDDSNWVTAAGLARQRAEYRILVEDKIPANSKAIGSAAALGDLSENSEWEAAMEEQRNLTGRAQDMDQQLRKVRLLEDAEIPDDVVAPGTRVTFVDLDSGAKTSYRLLGPWDCTEDDIVNYKAPIAAAFLGLTVGSESDLDTPEGVLRFRIESIERII